MAHVSPGSTPVEDRWASAVTVAESTAPSADGDLRLRVRIARVDGAKYPLLRIEEAYQPATAGQPEKLLAQQAMVADHLMVKPGAGVDPGRLVTALAAMGGNLRTRKPVSGLYLFAVPDPTSVDGLPDAMAAFKSLGAIIEVAEPDFLQYATATPDDPSFSAQWSLHNTGHPGADIAALSAWDITTGSRSVVVGVIDSGIDYTHPDLAANIWTNPGEIPGNGIDDDGDGYVDDVRGWDFANDDADPMDDNLHGTHCAGIIGAEGNNALGIAGVNWQVSLVPLKFLGRDGYGYTSDAIEAVSYSRVIGVGLTSNSWGGGANSQALYDAIAAAGEAGQLFVAAAGNEAVDTDYQPRYPAGYDLANIVSVAASDSADVLATFSNFGAASVDLAAPGVSIISTTPGGTYTTLSGTSMAAPHVAGAVALLLAKRAGLDASTLKATILGSVDTLPSLDGKVLSGGRLNVHAALESLDHLLLAPFGGYAVNVDSSEPAPEASTTYTLTNPSVTAHTWQATVEGPWTLDVSQGTLQPGETATIHISVDAGAASYLPAGTYRDHLDLVDLTSGQEYTRALTYVILAPALYSYDLSFDPGWPRTGEWAYGVPAGAGGGSYGYSDPHSGFTGSAVFGVSLYGRYPTATGNFDTLTAGPFDLAGQANTRLQFRRWLNSDYYPFVSATVDISTDGTLWHTLWSNGQTYITESEWSLQDIDLSAYADDQPHVYVRWTHAVLSASARSLTGWNIDDILIRGAPAHTGTFDPLMAATEGAGLVEATLHLQPAPDTPITILLSSSDPLVSVPTTPIEVVAGTTEVQVPLTILDDDLLDGDRTIRITPLIQGYAAAPLLLTVYDNETATLVFALPESFTEGTQVTGTLSVTPAPDVSVRVALNSSAPDIVSIPQSVVIPAGSNSVTFNITCPENSRIEPAQTASLHATVHGWSGAEADVVVADNESRALTLSMSPSLAEGAGTVDGGGSVSISGTLAAPLEVALASADTSLLQVPATAVIPAGSTSISFPVTLLDNATLDGVRHVQVTASEESYLAGEADAVVADDDPASFSFAPIASPRFPGEPFTITVTARDIDGEVASGYRGTVALAGLLGGTAQTVTPGATGSFTAGVWTGTVAVPASGAEWSLTAADGAATGTSGTFAVQSLVVTTVTANNSDIVYDPGTQRIYTALGSTLVPINPENGAKDTAVTVASGSITLLSRAADGSRLWIAYSGTHVKEVMLPGLVPGADITLDSGYTLADLACLPDAPDTVITLETSTTKTNRVRAYSGGAARPNFAYASDVDSIEAGSAGRIYGYASTIGNRFTRFNLSVDGMSVQDSVIGALSAVSTTIRADGRLVATSKGQVIDGETDEFLASLPYSSGALVQPEEPAGRIYVLSSEGTGLQRLHAYDTGQFSECGRLDITGVSGTAGRLIRWGAQGLAFRTPTQVFIINTALIPAEGTANLEVTQLAAPSIPVVGQPVNLLVKARNLGGGIAEDVVLTCTLSSKATLVGAECSQGTVDTSQSPIVKAYPGAMAPGAEVSLWLTFNFTSTTSLTDTVTISTSTSDAYAANNQSTSILYPTIASTAGLTKLATDAQGLAYDPSSHQLLMTRRSSAAVLPNRLIRVDPTGTGSLSADYVGYNPSAMSLTDNGQYAYVATYDAHRIARAPVIQGTAPVIRFGTGYVSGTNGTSYVTGPFSLLTLDGRPEAVVASRGYSASSKYLPLALYSDGEQKPSTVAFTNSPLLGRGETGEAFYAIDGTSSSATVTHVGVHEDGLASLGSVAGFPATSLTSPLKRAGSLLYAANGRVVDPTIPATVANLGITGPVEPSVEDDTLYILNSSTLRSYDLQTLAPYGTLSLPNFGGGATALVRCGGRRVAFLTGTGDVYIVDAPKTVVPDPALRVLMPPRLTEGAETAPGLGHIEILHPAAQDITVTLESSDPSALEVTRVVVLPAGATSADFDISVPDNSGLNGSRALTVTPVVTADYTPKAATTIVDDDETAVLTVTLPTSVTEGVAGGVGTVTLSGPADTALTVSLASSNTSKATVPASVVIPTGATSVDFAITTPDNTLLDGTQTSTITASVANYTSGSGTLTILDNETFTLAFPNLTTSIDESTSALNVQVYMSGTTVAPVTVSFSSSDSDAIVPPSSYTLAAGKTSFYAYYLPKSDGVAGINRTVTITATADGFTPATAIITLVDTDPAYGVWSTISGPKTAGSSFSATLNLLTTDGRLATSYSGTAALSATCDQGAATLQYAPVTLRFSKGSVTSTLALLTSGTGMRLIAAVPNLEPIPSNTFQVQSAALSRFDISPIPSPQDDTSTVAVGIDARDVYGNRVDSYAGSAALSTANTPRIVGTGTSISTRPFNGYQSRTQTIYLAEELGEARDFGAIRLSVTKSLTTYIPNFIIRIRPTTLSSYADAGWETEGWTTVYKGPVTIPRDGWSRFRFPAPYRYDGSSNLMVDFSFDTAASTDQSVTLTTATASARTLAYTTFGKADPLTWSGSTPVAVPQKFIPNVAFEPQDQAPATTPADTGPFDGGRWEGTISFSNPAKSVSLVATDGTISGQSSAFAVQHTAPEAAPEPPVSGGNDNTISWTPPGPSMATQAEAAPASGFAADTKLSSPWLTAPTYTFTGLSDGPWIFHVRSRVEVPSQFTWSESTQEDFANADQDGTSAEITSGSITLANASDAATEDFDEPDTAWSATMFSLYTGSTPLRSALGEGEGPATNLSLPINQGGDLEAIIPGGAAMRAYSTRFLDGSIEAIIAPGSPTGGTCEIALLLRAQTSSYPAYGATVQFNADGTAKADFCYYTSSSTFPFNTSTATFPVSPKDNLRVRFTASGSKLILRIWRLTADEDHGAIVETPVNYANGGNTLTALDTRIDTAGVAGLRAWNTYTSQRCLFDDITVTKTYATYVATGTATSPVISPADFRSWHALTWHATQPEGTSVAIDVLDADGNVLATDVASGTDLDTLPDIASQTALRLRARLTSTDSTLTPSLDDWNIEYEYAPPAVFESLWSPTVSSIQDATAPAITVTSPALTPTASYTLTGTASDANGLSTFTVGEVPVATAGSAGAWSVPLTLHPGTNSFDLFAADVADPANIRALTFTIEYTPDADGDGLPDEWEATVGLNPASPDGDDGARGDSDHDGLPNLLEYALGLHPDVADWQPPVTCTQAVDSESGDACLVVAYHRLVHPGTLDYRIQTSSDLADWTDLTPQPQAISTTPDEGGLTETISVRVAPPSSPGKVFIRLAVTAP